MAPVPASAEIVLLAKSLAAAGGSFIHAWRMSEASGAPDRVTAVLKAAVTSGGLVWGSELAVMSRAFLESITPSSAALRVIEMSRRVPLGGTGVGFLSTASGSIVAAGAPKPVTSLNPTDAVLDREKATAQVVISAELARAIGADATNMIGREMRRATTAAMDTQFFAALTASAPTAAATADPLADLANALSAVVTDGSSLIWIASRDTAIRLAVAAAGGMRLFPEIGVGGGELLGAPLLVSDGLPAATLMLADGSGILAAAEEMAVDSSDQVDLEMSTTPADPPTTATVLRSLWQSNLTVIRAEIFFGVKRWRASAVRVITSTGAW